MVPFSHTCEILLFGGSKIFLLRERGGPSDPFVALVIFARKSQAVLYWDLETAGAVELLFMQ